MNWNKVIYWTNAVGFIFTELILLALVENNVIREWVFDLININLGIYMYGVGKLRRRLIELEKASGNGV